MPLYSDATFTSRPERDRLVGSVRGAGARVLFLECTADEATIERRLEARDATSVSDARFDVYRQQVATQDALGADEPVITLDTTMPIAVQDRDLCARLWDWRRGRPVAREGSHGQG